MYEETAHHTLLSIATVTLSSIRAAAISLSITLLKNIIYNQNIQKKKKKLESLRNVVLGKVLPVHSADLHKTDS